MYSPLRRRFVLDLTTCVNDYTHTLSLGSLRRVEENEEQADQLPGPASPPYAGIDDLIERVTNAVLQKLQNTQFNDNAGTGNVSLPGTASAVQASVVAEPVINELSGS